ncbi:MAG: threonine synthase [Xanthomonadales bacterium]|nr:threonine synthase [Xanthomonadales bacterium]
MDLINIKHPEEAVSFKQAVLQGLGSDQGLFFPRSITPLEDVDSLLQQSFVPRSAAILHHLLDGELDQQAVLEMAESAFDFPLPTRALSDTVSALELFHGPSLAFKDFGARFMARCLVRFRDQGPMTILTATSGDTGAAVAHAYYQQAGIKVVILYPKGRISPLQEKLFCTLGGNIRTVAVNADFDTCQALVKQSFDDPVLRRQIGLNSANSINIARLVAQACYYFEAAAQSADVSRLVFSVPSGNFGNVTAGLLARALGLPYKRLIAATNANDTVPRFLTSGRWNPHTTVATLTNAMDISNPNNFPRVLELETRHKMSLSELLSSFSLSDEDTRSAMLALWQQGYMADPHSALAWAALQSDLKDDELGCFLCTAHPAKFIEAIKDVLEMDIPLPDVLAEVQAKKILSSTIMGDFAELKSILLQE